MEKQLHIVCLDVPFPPDYGGVFDLYYKIRALHAKGIVIHLHCFEYGRGHQEELKKYCSTLNYYKRKKGLAGLSLNLPYIVSSRANKQLLQNLLLDAHPILLEGIHCAYFLSTGQLKNRKVFLRLHNVEYAYYRNLAKAEHTIKKLYYQWESLMLRKFEKRIASCAILLSVTLKDKRAYETVFQCRDIRLLPLFLPWKQVNSSPGQGSYCLYHGNLSVAENELAATWILIHLGGRTLLPLVIAGGKASQKLKALAKEKNVVIEESPDDHRMKELISGAHIHILPSFNTTGIKIKLLHALFNGRHCLINDATDKETGLEGLSHYANTPEEFRSKIHSLVITPFSQQEKELRNMRLTHQYNNEKNAEQLIAWIY